MCNVRRGIHSSGAHKKGTRSKSGARGSCSTKLHADTIACATGPSIREVYTPRRIETAALTPPPAALTPCRLLPFSRPLINGLALQTLPFQSRWQEVGGPHPFHCSSLQWSHCKVLTVKFSLHWHLPCAPSPPGVDTRRTISRRACALAALSPLLLPLMLRYVLFYVLVAWPSGQGISFRVICVNWLLV